MAVTALSGQRWQGSTTTTTNTQATGSTSDLSVYYNTSTHQRRFLGERFNTGHALVGKTITEVQFDLLKSGSPNDVYDLVVLSTSDAVTTLESVDLSLVGTSFATYTFDDFTSFTLGAGERIGIYANAQSGGGSTPYVRVAHTGSDVIANANMYQIHDEGNVDVTGDLKYTIKYSATDKDSVTDVPVGSQFEETDTRKFYQYAGFSDGLGSSVDGTTTGAVLSTSTKKLGTGSVFFDGSNDYGSLDGLTSATAMSSIKTISGWFNVTMTANARLYVWGDANVETALRVGIYTSGSDPNVIDITCIQGGSTYWQIFTGDDTFLADTWNHFVITHNGTTPKIYINGTESTYTWSTETDKTVWWTALRSAVANNFTIGCKALLNGSGRTEFYDGQMTNIAFWNEEIDSVDASAITALYNSGDGALANTIPTNQTAYYNCQALEDGTYILENYGTTWSTSSSYYAPTCSEDNNYNGVVLNTNSCIKGRVLKKITAYLAKVGSPNTSGTIKLGVWEDTNSGSSIDPIATSLVEIQDDIGSLNTLGSTATPVAITVTLPSTRTLEEYDTIGLELTGGNYDLSHNVAWQYTSGTDVFDGGTTTDTKFTTRNRYTGSTWSGPTMTSDMRCTITTDSDSILNSVITTTYPSLPNGTTFLTSDTNKLYMFDGTSAWNEVG